MKDEVKNYIDKQNLPQKEILKKLRKLFLKTIPNCDEKKTWGVITFSKNRFYLAALKDRVHIGFAINGLSKEEVALFEGKGKTMRHVKISFLEDIDEKKLKKLIRIVDKKVVCKPC